MSITCKNCGKEMQNYYYCKNCGRMTSIAIIFSITGVVFILFLSVWLFTPKKNIFKENNTISDVENVVATDEKSETKDDNISYNDNFNEEMKENIVEEKDVETLSQKNAVWAAKNYIKTMPFSYSGLIEQLEYEKYSHEDAVYGVDNCGADWFEQAAKSAKQYLNIMPFSREGLIEQLEYEGFTYDQAVYGVDQSGL